MQNITKTLKYLFFGLGLIFLSIAQFFPLVKPPVGYGDIFVNYGVFYFSALCLLLLIIKRLEKYWYINTALFLVIELLILKYSNPFADMSWLGFPFDIDKGKVILYISTTVLYIIFILIKVNWRTVMLLGSVILLISQTWRYLMYMNPVQAEYVSFFMNRIKFMGSYIRYFADKALIFTFIGTVCIFLFYIFNRKLLKVKYIQSSELSGINSFEP